MNIYLFSELPDSAANADAPTWIHLLPTGTFRGVDGRGPFRVDDAQAVIANSMAKGPLAIDENHATDHAMKTGQPSPARGWIKEMQARPDGIYGRVEWTPAGQQLMTEKAYRGISPVMATDKGGVVVVRVLRAALLNTPNIAELHTLHTQQEESMDPKAIRAALGLPDTADEAAILAAITSNAQAVTLHSQQINAIAKAAGAEANVSAEGLVTVLMTQRATAGDTNKLANEIITLQSQLATLNTERARDKATAFIDAAIKAGKNIGVLRDHYITQHCADPARVEKEINGMANLNAGGLSREQIVHLQGQGGDGDDEFSATDAMTCKKMGISKEAFIANRKKKKAMQEAA